jgi:hypothetical protein
MIFTANIFRHNVMFDGFHGLARLGLEKVNVADRQEKLTRYTEGSMEKGL